MSNGRPCFGFGMPVVVVFSCAFGRYSCSGRPFIRRPDCIVQPVLLRPRVYDTDSAACLTLKAVRVSVSVSACMHA